MGIMDKLGGLFGGNKSPALDSVSPPSVVLKENGIDPSDLNFKFNANGTVGVSGTAASQAEIDRIRELVEGIPGVTGVSSNITVRPAEVTPDPEPERQTTEQPAAEAAAAEAKAAEPQATGRTYTVQSGDSLWKIAAEMYGEGNKYMKIFEANTHILKDPDKIFPGQELVIPELDD